MASAAPTPVRSRKGLKLSSIHAGKRKYPKAHLPDLQLSSEDPLSTSSSADTLPGPLSPTSPKSHPPYSFASLVLLRHGIQPPNSRAFWILLWFFLNFSLTLSNKVVLNRFPFPYSITALHALGGCIGTWLVMRPEDRLPTLSSSEIIVLVSFSTLYTLNIVVSNVSLQLVTVPFHQVVRSSAPFFTFILSALLIHSTVTRSKLISLIPVVAGVGLATYGDYYYTLPGFLLTLLGTILASLKTVVTNILQSPYSISHQSPFSHPHQNEDKDTSTQRPRARTSKEHSRSSSISITVSFPPTSTPNTRHPSSSLFSSIPKLHLTPLQLLHLLSPLALFQCILLAAYFGEHTKLLSYLYLDSTGNHTSSSSFLLRGFNGSRALNKTVGGVFNMNTNTAVNMSAAGVHLGSLLPGVLGLTINAFMAFALNIVSFHTNRSVGALSMSVAANVKQVLTILSSVVLFNLTITRMNAVGIFLTLVGGGWYASIDLRERGLARSR